MAAQFHTALSELIWHMAWSDGLKVPLLASGELAVRHLVKLELAISQNARRPDWEVLDRGNLDLLGRILHGQG